MEPPRSGPIRYRYHSSDSGRPLAKLPDDVNRRCPPAFWFGDDLLNRAVDCPAAAMAIETRIDYGRRPVPKRLASTVSVQLYVTCPSETLEIVKKVLLGIIVGTTAMRGTAVRELEDVARNEPVRGASEEDRRLHYAHQISALLHCGYSQEGVHLRGIMSESMNHSAHDELGKSIRDRLPDGDGNGRIIVDQMKALLLERKNQRLLIQGLLAVRQGGIQPDYSLRQATLQAARELVSDVTATEEMESATFLRRAFADELGLVLGVRDQAARAVSWIAIDEFGLRPYGDDIVSQRWSDLLGALEGEDAFVQIHAIDWLAQQMNQNRARFRYECGELQYHADWPAGLFPRLETSLLAAIRLLVLDRETRQDAMIREWRRAFRSEPIDSDELRRAIPQGSAQIARNFTRVLGKAADCLVFLIERNPDFARRLGHAISTLLRSLDASDQWMVYPLLRSLVPYRKRFSPELRHRFADAYVQGVGQVLRFDRPPTDETCWYDAQHSSAVTVHLGAIGRSMRTRPLLEDLLAWAASVLRLEGRVSPEEIEGAIKVLGAVEDALPWQGKKTDFRDSIQNILAAGRRLVLDQGSEEGRAVARAHAAYLAHPKALLSRTKRILKQSRIMNSEQRRGFLLETLRSLRPYFDPDERWDFSAVALLHVAAMREGREFLCNPDGVAVAAGYLCPGTDLREVASACVLHPERTRRLPMTRAKGGSQTYAFVRRVLDEFLDRHPEAAPTDKERRQTATFIAASLLVDGARDMECFLGLADVGDGAIVRVVVDAWLWEGRFPRKRREALQSLQNALHERSEPDRS